MLRGAALLERLLAVPVADRDAWVDELLGLPQPPPDLVLPRGSVPYLPAGVAEILAMVRELPIGPDDELVDLGSGLGRAVILAHLLTGARARGIEIQAPLVTAARTAARGLPIAFTHANATDTPLDGSTFFLYAPFNGEMLAKVLDRLHEVARRRAIAVCTVDLELDTPWLTRRATDNLSLAIYESQPRSVG